MWGLETIVRMNEERYQRWLRQQQQDKAKPEPKPEEKPAVPRKVV